MPLANGLSVTVSIGNTTSQLQNLYNNQLATNVTMGDDSNVKVPLQFTFPFFGQNFTESWMYSNGGINFKSGNVPGGFCCSGLDLTTLRDPSYNYSIVPLWTDLIALQGGKHYTLGTSSSMTYGWYGVSEYADTSKRSSFEVTIENSGKINTVFSGALVSYHQVTSGIIGDISKGEYYQYYTGSGLSSGPFSWTLNSTSTSTSDPCKDNPLSSPACPGYINLVPTTTTTTAIAETTSPIVEPVTASAQQQDTQSTGQIQIPGTTPLQTAAATNQTTAAVATTSSPATAEKSVGSVNLSFALNLISRNADRERTFQQQAVAGAVAEAQAAGDRALQVGGAVATTAIVNSMSSDSNFSGSGIQATSSTSRSTGSVVAVQQQVSNSMLPSAQSFGSISQTQQTNSFQLVAPITLDAIQSTQPQKLFEVQVARYQEPELPQQTSNFMTDRGNPLREIIEAQQQTPTEQEQPTSTVKANPQPNEVAVGVVLERMATIPQGYASYLNFALRDASFYEPKEVYKNQTIVDNVRVLRGLGSDQKHQDLVNLQYK